MIGQNEAFKFWYDKNYLNGVFVIVGTKPNWFNSKDSFCALPCIYTEKDTPRPIDLAFLTNQVVHLIHGDCTDEQFFAWYVHLTNINPKILMALDSENKVYVSKH
jgi:hypothetical protein